jgi:hypothetical protein
MTLQEKERLIERIGGSWAASMRCSREAMETRSAAAMAVKGSIDSHSPQHEVVCQELAHYTKQYERLLDQIIELARRDQKRMSPLANS